MMTASELKDNLDALVERYNVAAFAEKDPVQFPRRFSDKRDIEISALLTSTIAWGRRPMILNNAEKLHALLQHEPYRFISEGDIDGISEANIHRTFFGRHLRYFLRGLREVYSRYGSLEDFALACGAPGAEAPAWVLADALNKELRDANSTCPLDGPSRCLPDKVADSALKRFNMALRWLVRRDGIVDIGCWDALHPSQLYIPLDVHSANTSRALGLLSRKQNDRRAVVELTEALRRMRPDDPTVYDFALFGAGEAGLI
ncbi:MAG: TIGR02757 family protein [Muribaculaceae bacterium]|nr:TIGR02757 family protein [Muribaculaceae bacterium]